MSQEDTQTCSAEPPGLLRTAPQDGSRCLVSLRCGLARGLALFLGLFSLLNVLGEWRFPGFDANLWWLDLRPMSPASSRFLLGLSGLALVVWGTHRSSGRWVRLPALAAALVLLAYSIRNVGQFWRLWSQGTIDPGFPLPFSLLVAIALAFVVLGMLRPLTRPGVVEWMTAVLTVLLCLVLFPLGQMMCFGKTDYRRPADAAVVFGARAYADGRPSDALTDRIRTGCDLYREGLVRWLVFSGGPGDGAVHETEAMRRTAVDLGVPAAAVVLDTGGVNTQATVQNTVPMFRDRGWHRVLAVSHFYHLPRIKMTYQREGVEVYTVPAREFYTLTQMPFFMVREIAAQWVYYLRPLVP